MTVFLFLLHKVFIFTFILAALYLVKEGFRFVRGLLGDGTYPVKKYTLLWIGIAVAHIVTTLITGFII